MEILGTLFTVAISHPEFLKELFFFFLAWGLLKKGIDKALNKLTSTIDGLTKTLQEHIVQTDLRMQDGERSFAELRNDNQIIKTEIQNIKSHVGIK